VTDYLQALVERARGEGRSVRPRLAPRFAPGLPATIDVEVDAPVPPTSRRDGSAAPPRPGSRPADRPPTRVPAPPGARAGREPGVDPPPPGPHGDAPVVPSPASEPPAQVVPGEPAEVETVANVVVERRLVEEARPRTEGPPAAVEVTVARQAPAEAREEAPSPRVAERAPGPGTAAPALPAEPAAAGFPAEDPSTVVVSIGRIEVNADRPGPPPALPAARPWAGPRLSLDDYLRERNGSRR